MVAPPMRPAPIAAPLSKLISFTSNGDSIIASVLAKFDAHPSGEVL